ncbi:MAG TPA: hypothetical protein VN706_16235 [Gemmatimonadaceae bacterium]|nr:hypothetical protein [Gemmatimonadaceae bacterium]
MKQLRFLPIAASAVLAAACSATNDTSPNDKTLDINTVLTQVSAGDPSTFAGVRTAFALPTVATTATLPTSCTYSPANQRFDCAPVKIGSLTFTTSYYVLDAAGGSLTTTNATLAAAVRVITDVTGLVDVTSTGSVNVTVNKHSDLTMSGLISGPRVLNGTSTEHDLLATSGSVSTSTTIDLTSTTSNVVLPSATTSNWPQSGSITSDLADATKIGSLPAVPTSMHSVITFNGTSIVTFMSTIAGTTQTCRIDLSGNTAASCV